MGKNHKQTHSELATSPQESAAADKNIDLLDQYFCTLITKVETSDLGNNGKDENGFFQPTRAFVLQRLNMLKDLQGSCENQQAKAMLKTAWAYVVEHVPAEWLVLNPSEKQALKELLK